MAKVKVRREGNLLREDECQPLTTEQMNDIKSQFHPSNTANVNIVPYEIYDEDGEEIVVGEVRKTIDGVKKKKPVYEKIIEYDNINMSGKDSYTVIDNALLTTKLQNLDKIIESDTTVIVRSVNNSETSNEYYINREDGTYSVKQFWTSQGNLYYDIRLIIFYTKTTDTWQPI